jgi:hypothetical protein
LTAIHDRASDVVMRLFTPHSSGPPDPESGITVQLTRALVDRSR